MKKFGALRFCLPALLAVLVLAGCGSAEQGKTLRVGVRESVPWFGYKNPVSGTYSGMEVELTKMLSEVMGYGQVEYVSVTAETREQALKDGTVDLVAATFTITEERQKEFDFSTPYYDNYLRVMVQDSSLFESLSDLKGKTVGVSKGSTAALYLAQEMASQGIIPVFNEESFDSTTFAGGVTFKNIDTYPDLDAALEVGEIDAVCTDGSILAGYLSEDRHLLPEVFTKQAFGVCTVKGSALSEKINKHIEQWKADGTMEELLKKWDLNQ